MPSTVDVSPESQVSPNSAQFSTIVFKQIAHSPASVGKSYYDPSARLSKLFLLDSRLAVRESVYIGPAVDGGIEEQPPGRDVLRVKRRQHSARRTRAVRYRNDFVVDDWDESVSGMGVTAIPNTGISTVSPHAIPQWTTDYTAVYAVATGQLMLGSSEEFVQHLEDLFRENINTWADRIASATLDDQVASRTMYVLKLVLTRYIYETDRHILDSKVSAAALCLMISKKVHRPLKTSLPFASTENQTPKANIDFPSSRLAFRFHHWCTYQLRSKVRDSRT